MYCIDFNFSICEHVPFAFVLSIISCEQIVSFLIFLNFINIAVLLSVYTAVIAMFTYYLQATISEIETPIATMVNSLFWYLNRVDKFVVNAK